MRGVRFLLLSVLFIIAFGGCKVLYVSDADVEYKTVSEESAKEDAEVESLIAPYREDLESSMNKVIGTLEVDLVKERPESNMGNWLVDIFYDEADAVSTEKLDFAVLNQGGLRLSSLTKGPILRGEIFELIPFDNVVSVIEASGAEVMLFLDHIAKGRGWPVSHQLKMEIKDGKAINVAISDQAVDLSRTYRFAVPDYVAGGGSCLLYTSPSPRDLSTSRMPSSA